MSRTFINFMSALLIPLLKAERMLSYIQNGRIVALIKLYHSVMDSRHNPLSHMPDTNTRHLVMPVLAWMWCIVFSMWMGSILVFGVSASTHTILFAVIFVTVGVFETAKLNPVYFGGLGGADGGEHKY